jgi:hypothetical protein
MCINGETEIGHWSRESQSHAPAHVLLQYLRGGWKPSKGVTVEVILLGGNRQTQVYHFVLTQNNESIEMPVLTTPIVPRLIRKYDLTIWEIPSQQTAIHPQDVRRKKSKERVTK